MTRQRPWSPPVAATDTGVSLAEVLVVAALVTLVATMAVPSTMTAMDAGRAREAAAFLASRMRLAKQQAVSRTTSVGLVFDATGPSGRWTFRVCVDGNGNGLRRTDISKGQDSCPEGPYDITVLYPGVSVFVDSSLRGPDGEAGSADPIRLGASNLASFSSSGSCTAGSVYLRSARGEQFVVRIAGTNGRLRILRYDRGSHSWRDA